MLRLVSTVLILLPLVQAFWLSAQPHCATLRRTIILEATAADADADALKQDLLNKIRHFRQVQARDGAVSVDFGVKGGELNATSRAPQKVDYYAVSTALGQAVDAVLTCCEALQACNPTLNATAYWGDRQQGTQSPLHGPWKLLFTTAADASFSPNSTRGDARVQNIVHATRGRIVNQIDFLPRDNDKKPPALQQFNVILKATAASANRVQLQFRYAKLVFSRLMFLPLRWSLYIPVPATFITQCIRLWNRLRGKAKAQAPEAYFDVLYLDPDLRVHQTGEDNWFVQARPTWTNALDLME